MADVADWIDEINDHGFEDADGTRKLGVINDTLADICSREPWAFLEASLALTFAGDSYASNWPSDFKAVLSIFDSGRKLHWIRREDARLRWGSSINNGGTPSHYYFLGGRAQFTPVPASGYTGIEMDYLRSHPEVSEATLEAAILLPPRHHRAVVTGSLYKLYMLEDDPELAEVFKNEYEGRLATMREDLSRLQYDSPDNILVLMDDWDVDPLW